MTSPWDIDSALGFWLHRAFSSVRARTLLRFREAGFDGTPEQWAVLVRLWQQDGRTHGELADLTFRDPAGITRLVDALVAKGLVKRTTDSQDRRVRRVWLTPAGDELQLTLVPVVRSLTEELTAPLDEREAVALRDALRKVAKNLDEG